MTTINLFTFITEEFKCPKLGCKYNSNNSIDGYCECMDSMHLRDIIIESAKLLVGNKPTNEYTCMFARPKIGLCLHCGKELDYWKEDSGENWVGCRCQE